MDSILLEAKREYTEQVVSKVTRPLYDEIYNIWKKSLGDDPSSPMRHFQDSLENLAKLDEKDMLEVTDRCIHKTGCSYFGDLITAIFVAHTRVLLSVRKDSTKDGYRLQVPTPNRFVRSCLLCCAREFWKSPYLYYQNEQNNKITKIQVQKNLREAETIIAQAVRDTIRSLLPLKDVLDVAIVKGDTGDIIIDADYPSKESNTHPESVTVEESKEEPQPESNAKVEDTAEESAVDTTDDTVLTSTEEMAVEPTKDIVLSTTEETKEDTADVSNTRTVTEENVDPLKEAIAQVQESVTPTDLPEYDETDIPDDESTGDDSGDDFPGWDTIEIKSPPDEKILMESVSDAISLDEPVPEVSTDSTKETTDDDVTIEAEEL